MRPRRPSIPAPCDQCQCHGSNPRKALVKITMPMAPENLVKGEAMVRERNQRTAYMARNTGTRKTETPMACSSKSAVNAPAMPIQLEISRPPWAAAAVFIEGSAGEYETRDSAKRMEER